ncbi:MAG: hypothetical protein AABM64_00275 [Pseudomonadota bacterium]
MATAQKFALIGAILVLIVVAAGTIAGLNRPVSVPNVTFIGFKGDHVHVLAQGQRDTGELLGNDVHDMHARDAENR